jgi:AAHS family 4-hydroxybenzoate transporter-like MFS transporter
LNQAADFAAALETRPVRGYQLAVVALVATALVVDGLDYQVLALVAPLILSEWGIARSDFGFAMAAALFGMAFGAAAGGWIGDRVGRRKALVAAVVLFGIATMAASRAENTTALAVMRVAGGLGFGAAGPNAIALATEWLPLRLRTYVVALLAVGTPAGGMIGAAILPALLPSLGWRGVFGLLGLAAVLLGLILLLVLRESPSWLLRRARTEASRVPQPGSVPMPGPEGEAREAGGRERLFTAGYARLNVGIGLGFAALTAVTYGLGAWMPALLTAAGLSLDQALRASLGFNACSVLGALAAGWLARAQGSRRVMLASTLAAVLLLAMFGLALEAGTVRFVLYAFAAGVGAAASIGVTTLYAMAALLYPPDIRSSGIGLGMTMGRIGGIAMSFAGGYLLDFAGGSAIVLFGVLALCALLATSAGWLVRAHIPRVGAG